MSLLLSKKTGKRGILGIWHITETLDELMKMKNFSKKELYALKDISNEQRKKEWLAARIIAEQLTGEKSIQIIYDKNNKPFFKNLLLPEQVCMQHFSLSHSHRLLAMIIDDNETGIDIELIKPAVVRIKEKFLSAAELNSLQKENLEGQLTVYWCAKEALYKLYGKKNLAFKENLIVEPFKYSTKGTIRAGIFSVLMKKQFELSYEKISADKHDYMLAHVIKGL